MAQINPFYEESLSPESIPFIRENINIEMMPSLNNGINIKLLFLNLISFFRQKRT